MTRTPTTRVDPRHGTGGAEVVPNGALVPDPSDIPLPPATREGEAR
jgi:hypothetical protein